MLVKSMQLEGYFRYSETWFAIFSAFLRGILQFFVLQENEIEFDMSYAADISRSF